MVRPWLGSNWGGATLWRQRACSIQAMEKLCVLTTKPTREAFVEQVSYLVLRIYEQPTTTFLNQCNIAKPEAAYTSTRTADVPCPMDPPASLAPVQNLANSALHDRSYSIRRHRDQPDHVGATSAISDFGLPDFSQRVPSDARRR